MSNVPHGSEARERLPNRRRLWLWFLAGFVVVFLGLAIAYPMHFYDGDSIRQVSLWEYYYLEMQLELNATGNIGPTSGNAAAALSTAVTHVVIAAVAGVLVMGLGWMTQKRSSLA